MRKLHSLVVVTFSKDVRIHLLTDANEDYFLNCVAKFKNNSLTGGHKLTYLVLIIADPTVVVNTTR